ncbi:MAG TPA: sigma-70 family RNA polymerase sigma factor [Planctomycetota bacterium]
MRSLDAELLHHAAALRNMARALVGAQDAEDLVQETALQALRRPPARPGPVGGWLSSILHHFASKQRRALRRRQWHEPRRPEAEPPLSPDRIAEHRDTVARLHTAFMALPEPFRGTLLLRYFEDLTPTEIAARTGVPLPTVKSRLQRGLELLRESLEARNADWRAALGAVFDRGSGTVIAATAAGVFVMANAVKLALGGVAVAIAAMLWFGNATPGAPSPGAEPDAGPGAAVAAAPLSRGAESTAERLEADARTAATSTAGEARAVVRGRLVDEQGLPLAGCPVELQGHRIEGGMGKDFEREYSDWLLQQGGFHWQDLNISTGSDGVFEFAVAPSPLSLAIEVRRDGLEHTLGVHQLLRPVTKDLGDLPVPITCTLRTRVIDGNGLPVESPGLRIEDWSRVAPTTAWNPRESLQARIAGPVAGTHGAFTMALTAGTYRCTVAGRTIERGEHIVVPPRTAVHDHEIVVAALPTNDVLTGIVVDEQDLPLEGVGVYGSHGSLQAASCTGADGRFTLYRPAGCGPEIKLWTDKDGYESLRPDRAFRFGEPELRLVLRETCAIEVRAVTAADGAPVEDFRVRCWTAPGTNPTVYRNEGQDRASGHHPDGIAVVTDLENCAHLLVVEPHRQDLWRSEPVTVPVTRPGRTRVEVRLERAAVRVLRVLRADGRPVEDARVEVVEQQEGFGLGTVARPIERWDPRSYAAATTLLQELTTDARGEALLHGPAAREVALRVTPSGLSAQLVEHVRLDEAEPLVVTVATGARLIAQIGPPEFVQELRKACGLPVDGPAPKREHRNQPGFRLCRGDPRQREVMPPQHEPSILIAGDGTVVLEEAPPGDWQLGLEPWDKLPNQMLVWGGVHPVANVTLRAGETTEVTVDLRDWLPGELTGTLTCNGAPVVNAEIGVEVARPVPGFPRGRTFSQSKTDEAGRFRIRTRAGTIRLAVSGLDPEKLATQTAWVYSLTSVFLPAGSRLVQDFAVETCGLRLRVLDAAGQPVAGVSLFLHGSGADLQHGTEPSDADGRITCKVEAASFAVQVLPAKLQTEEGRVQFLRETKSSPSALASQRLPLGNVTGVPGKTTELEVRLPPEWNR